MRGKKELPTIPIRRGAAAHIYSRAISFYETSMRIVTSVPFMHSSQGNRPFERLSIDWVAFCDSFDLRIEEIWKEYINIYVYFFFLLIEMKNDGLIDTCCEDNNEMCSSFFPLRKNN